MRNGHYVTVVTVSKAILPAYLWHAFDRSPAGSVDELSWNETQSERRQERSERRRERPERRRPACERPVSPKMETMDLMQTIRTSTSVHESLLVALELREGGGRYDLFAEWLDKNSDGFYVRDLDHIIQVVDRLMDYLADSDEAQTILEKFLELCALPIMELKANERLSVRGYAQCKRFFSKFSSLWEVCQPAVQTKLAKALRCVVNGGRDPTVLRALQRDWQPEGMRLRITDQSFLQRVLRESGAVDTIVQQFLLVS
ncbi:hypothetical protein B484DRAFT_32583, partial [Ochromonadaceae sp. CCMP2298]